MLEIKDLHASVEGNEILKGISLSIKKGEIHAVMGPNGSGKSTLAKILSGHPSYEATGGEILFEGKNLFDMDAEERSLSGIFMGFQYPVEVPGVNNAEFLRLNGKLHRQLFEYFFTEPANDRLNRVFTGNTPRFKIKELLFADF